ncbi:MAG: CysS/YqeB C-terminal domain-containing protein, partial [Gammaproteobacteria bacterium]
ARGAEPERAARLAATLAELGGALGILQEDPDLYLQAVPTMAREDAQFDATEIEALIAQRDAARQAKLWGESDRIRDLLKARGIVLEDAAGGTTWRRQ